MDQTSALGLPAPLIPLGLLASLFSQQPQQIDPNDAANTLAAKMRLQSTEVPPPAQQPALDESSFDDKWNGLGMLNQDGVPLPQPRPASAPQGDNGLDQATLDALPLPSAPTQGPTPPQMPQVQSSAAPSSPGLLDRLTAGLANFGAGGRQGGLLGALAGTIQGASTGQRIDPIGIQNQTVQALTNRGIPSDMAQVMARDPQLLNQVLPLLMGVKPWQVTETTDMFGQKKPILINPLTGESKAVNIGGGAPNGGAAGVPSAQSAAGGAAPTINNFDMAKVDPNVKGWDYLKQFPPEVQDAAKAYMSGGVMPTGNPRNQGISTVAKMAAEKVAMDLGQPQLADDSLFSQRRKMRTDLASSSPNTMGGILANGKSAFLHLGELSDKYVDLGNYNGPNIPGGGHIATVENTLGNTIAPTSTTQAKIAAAKDNALKYGQEATKYYAGTGGGEAERMNALNSVNPATSSGNEQAAFLQTEKGLMLDRLQEKEAQIRDTLGDDYLKQHPVITPELQASLNKIDANIAKLRGQQPTQAAAQPAIGAQADPLAQARDAIARGADRTQVILRLQKNGINTAGL